MSRNDPPGPTRLPQRLLEAAPESSDVAVRAPGRANLIGEHTDYNDGYVLPAALELATYVVGRRTRGRIRLSSLDEPGEVDIDPATGRGSHDGWGIYATGVVRALTDEGIAVAGLDGVLASELPQGAGLSSSAALEVAIAASVAAEPVDPARLAAICTRAENHYVGTRSGIMDQLAAACGRAGSALLIDCRDASIEPVPLPDDVVLLLIDSDDQRGLSDSSYNERRDQCEAAAKALGVRSLRDADEVMLEQRGGDLDAVALKRARHVVSENRRVLEAARALNAGNLEPLGPLFAAAHHSLATDYEVSTPELDLLVRLAGETPGVIAARLTGAGFGGCTVNLVGAQEADAAGRSIVGRYNDATGRNGRHWVSRAADGLSRPAL